MDKISKYLIRDIKESIDINFMSKYEESFEGKSFSNFYVDMINELLTPTLSTADIKEMKNHYVKTLRRTKRRWFDYVKKELSPNYKKQYRFILKQIMDYKQQYIKYKDNSFIIHDIDKFKDEKLIEIEKWAVDDSFLITDFLYLNNYNESNIVKAFKNDLKYLIVMIIFDKYDSNIHSVITERPNSMINKPLFGQRERGKTRGKIIEIDDDRELVSEYTVGNNFQLQTVVSEKEIKKITESKHNIKLENWHNTDEKDSELYDYISMKRGKLFLTQKVVIVEISDICKKLYGQALTKQKILTEKRVLKLGGSRLIGDIEYPDIPDMENDRFVFHYFQYTKITTDQQTGKRIAIFKYTDSVYDEFLNKQTVKIYSDHMKNFELPFSREILFALQQLRINCYKKDQSYLISLPYDFFLFQFRFSSQNVKDTLKLIEKSLQELKDKGIVVKDFKKSNKSDFEIKLFELTDFEIHDFIDNNDNDDNYVYDEKILIDKPV
ncbi:MAG: hypothetical protein MJA82_18305 [Clostridia bacterium]|nr:hypothetical protein [Clostridia bacterium]